MGRHQLHLLELLLALTLRSQSSLAYSCILTWQITLDDDLQWHSDLYIDAMNILLAKFTWFFVPETNYISIEHMDVLFGGKDLDNAAKAMLIHVN